MLYPAVLVVGTAWLGRAKKSKRREAPSLHRS